MKPVFRSDVPAYSAPDRANWETRHGGKPFELQNVAPKFLSRARAAIERDASTIKFETAVRAWTNLDVVHADLLHVCQASGQIDDDEHYQVFFDPTTDSFWAYPFRCCRE